MKLEIKAYRSYADDVICVHLGGVLLGEIPVVGENRAGHGDDSSYFNSEEERVITESVIAWAKINIFNAV